MFNVFLPDAEINAEQSFQRGNLKLCGYFRAAFPGLPSSSHFYAWQPLTPSRRPANLI
jgi:hypothetical protein